MDNEYLVALDDGHGMETAGKRTPPIPELNGRVIRENEFNKAVVGFLDIELKRCGFKTLLVAPTDSDTSLSARTNLSNSKKADAYISIHYNAFDSKFDGYDPEGLSVHVYPGSARSRKLAENIIKYLKQGTSQKNRGIVENNFHVLRETKCAAILSENGFMDSKREAMLMIDVNFQKEVAREHAQGICDYFGVKYIAENQSVPTPTPISTTPQPVPAPSTPSAPSNIVGGSKVKIVGDKYTTGQTVPSWVKKETYTVDIISSDKALIKEILSWVYFKDLALVSSSTPAPSFNSYLVKVTASVLNIRSGAGTNFKVTGTVKKNDVYTIVEESNGWGKLKSGSGWISLSYTTKI